MMKYPKLDLIFVENGIIVREDPDHGLGEGKMDTRSYRAFSRYEEYRFRNYLQEYATRAWKWNDRCKEVEKDLEKEVEKGEKNE